MKCLVDQVLFRKKELEEKDAAWERPSFVVATTKQHQQQAVQFSGGSGEKSRHCGEDKNRGHENTHLSTNFFGGRTQSLDSGGIARQPNTTNETGNKSANDEVNAVFGF